MQVQNQKSLGAGFLWIFWAKYVIFMWMELKKYVTKKVKYVKDIKNLKHPKSTFLPLFQIQLTVKVVNNKNFTQVIFKGLFRLECAC